MHESRIKSPAPIVPPVVRNPEVAQLVGYVRILETAILNLQPAARREILVRLRLVENEFDSSNIAAEELTAFLAILEPQLYSDSVQLIATSQLTSTLNPAAHS